jgi:hypothetical protein
LGAVAAKIKDEDAEEKCSQSRKGRTESVIVGNKENKKREKQETKQDKTEMRLSHDIHPKKPLVLVVGSAWCGRTLRSWQGKVR